MTNSTVLMEYTITYDGAQTFDMDYESTAFTWLTVEYESTADLPYFTIGTRYGDKGGFSTAIGENIEAGYRNQVVVGKNNANKSTSAFEIGVGTGSTKNAVEIDWNGIMVIADTVDLRGAINLAGWTNDVIED